MGSEVSALRVNDCSFPLSLPIAGLVAILSLDSISLSTTLESTKEIKMPDKNLSYAFRGLVVSPPINIKGNGFYVRQSWLDEQELRFSLLFWDKLVWPTGFVHMAGNGEQEEMLEACGIIERPYYDTGSANAQGILRGQMAAYQEYESRDPGAWAIAQGENSLLVSGGVAEVGKGALIELARAVPIPASSVHVNEILELKERRRDELMRFRIHLEDLARQIATAEDRSEALTQKIKEVDDACADLMALGKDWRFPMHVSTFKASLNLKPSLVASVRGAWEFGANLGVEFATLAAAATGLYHGIKIDTDLGLRSLRRPASPFRYAYHIHKELV